MSLWVLLGCKAQPDGSLPPNIVWITSEDNSVHYLNLFHEKGAPTPNIALLAQQGLVYRNAFSNGPVCSVARSALISGCYGPRTGSQFHRKMVQVPLPDSLKMFPAYLREAGYYTTNNSKEDYNFVKGNDVWDESSNQASWRNRQGNQPFFHVINIGVSHESSLHFTSEQMDLHPTVTDQGTVEVFPNHPPTELFKYTHAYYRDRIMKMDSLVGEVIAQLRADKLLDNTIIFYFGDHGGVLPGSKGYIYETGIHVPLVIYIPHKYRDLIDGSTGGQVTTFVSFVDFGPTVLNIAGVSIPEPMDGQPFLGNNLNRDHLRKHITYSYADRFDEKYDMVRAVRKGNFKYIRNFQPFNFDGLMNNYRYLQLAYRQWDSLNRQADLNHIQRAFFQPKPKEMLFDLDKDPFETYNLAADPEHSATLVSMRHELNEWIKDMPDLSFYPEHILIEQAFDDPAGFGRMNKDHIARYLDIANLCLDSFEQIKTHLITSLNSKDPWDRYWGLVVCSSFGSEAADLTAMIIQMSKSDPELLNRVRAAEFLGLIQHTDPSKVMTATLYQSQKPAEALLILNSVVLMNSHLHGYHFDIVMDQIPLAVGENAEVRRRLQFLNVL